MFHNYNNNNDDYGGGVGDDNENKPILHNVYHICVITTSCKIQLNESI
jgi:hypothetical protein